MSKTSSSMLELGTQAVDFSLHDVISGKMLGINDNNKNTAYVLMFICNHCPYVKHIRAALIQMVQDYAGSNIAFIAINSNNIDQYPDDSPTNMKENALEYGYNFPYLYDETQAVAKAYHATCTPDFFVFDNNKILVYRGQLDDSRPGNNINTDGHSIRQALNCVLNHKAVASDQKPSLGCNIKWK